MTDTTTSPATYLTEKGRTAMFIADFHRDSLVFEAISVLVEELFDAKIINYDEAMTANDFSRTSTSEANEVFAALIAKRA